MTQPASNGPSKWWTPASAAASFCLSVGVSVWLVTNHEAHAEQRFNLLQEWVLEKVNGHIALDNERYDRLISEIHQLREDILKK